MKRFFMLFLLALIFRSAHAEWPNAATITPSDLPADPPRFEDFPARPVFKGKPARPEVQSHPRSRMFRTAIRAGAKKGTNFAGHYTIVSWGCGSGCVGIAIVDEKTGHVYHPKNLENIEFDNFDGFGNDVFTYRPDSRLIFVVGGINEDPGLRGISYFVWENNALQRIRFIQKPYE